MVLTRSSLHAGDKTEQLLYRLNNGEWNGRMQPKAVVLSIGINNILRERIYERTVRLPQPRRAPKWSH